MPNKIEKELIKVWTKWKVHSSPVFKRFFIEQNGRCALCSKIFDLENNPMDCHFDHCHKTKVYRGILCRTCNIGLGCFKDDIALFYKAIIYLNKNHGTLKRNEVLHKAKQPKLVDIVIQLGMQLQKELETKK